MIATGIQALQRGEDMDIFWILVILFDAIAFGTVTALAAKSRGREPFDWFLIGFIFGVFGLVALLVMKNIEQEKANSIYSRSYRSSGGDRIKKCPDCAEEIKFEARVCRFCGKRFDEEITNNSLPNQQVQTISASPMRNRIRDLRCLRCYTMNYSTDYVCSSCGKNL